MQKTDPFFSIIIPTYNRGHLIKKTLDSVLNQSYAAFEVIVVDDGGRDNTKDVVSSLADARIKYYQKENGERGAARNYGWSKAAGQYITFLDSDDLLYKNHLQEAYQFLISHVDATCFAQAYEIKNGQTGTLIKKAYQTKNIIVNDEILKGNFLSCFGVFVKEEIFEQVKFEEDRRFAGTEDWLLWLQLAARFPFYYSNTITGALLEHENRSVRLFDKESLEFRTQFLKTKLEEDAFFLKKYGYKQIQRIFAHMLSYTSLHLMMNKQRKEALSYLLKSVFIYPLSLFERRTFAIGKKFLAG